MNYLQPLPSRSWAKREIQFLFSHYFRVPQKAFMNDALKGLHETFWGTTNKWENKHLSSFLFFIELSEIHGTGWWVRYVVFCQICVKIKMDILFASIYCTIHYCPFLTNGSNLKTKIFVFWQNEIGYCNLTFWCIGLILNAFICHVIFSKSK